MFFNIFGHAARNAVQSRHLIALILIILLSPLAQAQQKITTIEGISEYQLANGLQVLLAPDSAKSRITVNMSYKVGSRHEGPGETGMAHLLEHLLFRSSPNFPDAMAEFSRRGMAANGSTTADLTNYYASFTADDATLDWYLGWQADAMLNIDISQKSLDTEMTVVRNELERGENSPFSVLLQQISAAAYVWHPYGRSVIGNRSDLAHIDVNQLRNFYKKYYQPDNAVLIITGDIDTANVLQLISKHFGAIAQPQRELRPDYTVEPAQQGPRSVVLKRSGESPLALVQYHIPNAMSDEYTNLALGTAMLADTPAGPLYKGLVDTAQASNVFGFARAMNKPGYAVFGAQVQKDPQAVLEQLSDIIENQAIDKLDEAALKRIKTAWLNDWQQIYNNQSSLASALSDAVANGDWRLFLIERDRIQASDLQSIKKSLHSWFIGNNRTSGIYIPTENPVYAPTEQTSDINQWLDQLKPGSERPAIASFDTDPVAINNATTVGELDLDNGKIKFVLLPKPASGQELFARIHIHFGTADDLKGKGIAPEITAAMLKRGSKKHNRQAIDDLLNELDADLYFTGQANVLDISIRSKRDNIQQVLSLAFDILRQPTFPANELDKIKNSLLTNINNQDSNPAWLVNNALQRNQQPWDQDDTRYTTDADEARQQVKQLTRQQILDFYNKFYGAGNITVSAVGDFEPNTITSQIQQSVAGWHQAPKFKRIANPWYPIQAKQFDIQTPGKANASYLAALPLQIQDNNPDWPALYLANYLFGGSEDSRLWQSVRTQQGLSYSVGSSVQASAYEPSGSLTIFASMAPENTTKITTAIKTVLNNTLDTGFSPAEVEHGKTSLLNFLKLGRSSDANLASKWLRYIENERNFLWDQKTIDAIHALDANTVSTIFRKYIRPDNFSIAVASDSPN